MYEPLTPPDTPDTPLCPVCKIPMEPEMTLWECPECGYQIDFDENE